LFFRAARYLTAKRAAGAPGPGAQRRDVCVLEAFAATIRRPIPRPLSHCGLAGWRGLSLPRNPALA